MKKGYFFIMDAFIAISVILLSLLLLFSFHSSQPYQLQGVYLSEDIMDIMATTKVFEINNDFVYSLFAAGADNITNTDNTLLEQTGDFYLTNRAELAEIFVRNVTYSLVPEKYGCELIISNTTHRFNVTINPGHSLQNESELLFVSKKMVVGLDENGSTWGPLVGEVRIWQ